MGAMQLFEKAKKAYAALDEVGPEGSPEREAAKEALHVSTAQECLELAKQNGGIYNKAAQFVASLQGGAGDAGIPKAYIEALAVLTDQAPFRAFADLDGCFIEEFGVSAKEAFAEIDETPIAAASIAQVHRAVMKDGRVVAVKIQYPWLRHTLTSDFAVFSMFGQQIKPGGFDLSWLVKDFQVSLTAEMDFTGEASNAERCAFELRARPDAYVPDVIHEFTSKRVLCTAFVENMTRCNDLKALKTAGFDSKRVGSALASIFAEMVFVHGHVHGDPHAGNVYVRERPNAGGKEPQIVLLDHGLYHDLSDVTRTEFCGLVNACVARDVAGTKKQSVRFAGNELHRFFPLILSPWFVFGSSDLKAADLKAAARGALPPGVKLADIGKFLVSLHDESGTNMLGVLHSLGYTKGILNELKFPETLRLRAFGKYAAIGSAIGVGDVVTKARARAGGGATGERNSGDVTSVSSSWSLTMRLAIILAAVRVEVLSWFVFVLAPLAPFLFILPGSVWTTSSLVAGPVYALAMMSLAFARVTEHPELAM
jgi:aarF domain-containing kinase|tara:strand:+ start:1145 stop:2761 length:1617 start_codon:yes stop_codon:yes gene_type:complete